MLVLDPVNTRSLIAQPNEALTYNSISDPPYILLSLIKNMWEGDPSIQDICCSNIMGLCGIPSGSWLYLFGVIF